MKKYAALILAAVLAAGLCACSKQQSTENATEETALAQEVVSADKNAVKANFDKATAFVEAAVDVKDMTANDNEDEMSMYRDWVYDEPENTEIPNEIEVNGKTITIGKTTVKDLDDLGMEVEKSMDRVEPQTGTAVTLQADNKTFILNVSNDTDKTVNIDDLKIEGFTTGFKDFTLPYSYSGIDFDSTVEDVIAKLGKPNYTIVISANDQNATITLNYSNSTTEGKTVTDDTLSVEFNYDPANNSAQLSSVNYSSSTGTVPEEDATQ